MHSGDTKCVVVLDFVQWLCHTAALQDWTSVLALHASMHCHVPQTQLALVWSNRALLEAAAPLMTAGYTVAIANAICWVGTGNARTCPAQP
jgi:hypothetical protein